MVTALLTGLQWGVTALEGAPSLPGVSAAQATEFNGKIRHIRLKKRRAGESFRIITRTSGLKPGAMGSVLTEARAALDGELIPLEVTSAERRNSLQVAASAQFGTSNLSAPVLLTLRLTEDGDFNWDEVGGYVPEVSIPLESIGSTATVALGTNGWKVRARLTSNGTLKAVISNENSAWNGQGLAGITYQIEGSDLGGELTVDEYRQTWVQELSDGGGLLELAGAVNLNSTLLDEDGGVVATRTAQSSLEEDNQDLGIDRIRLSETRQGDARLTVITFGQDNIAGLEVQVTDQETGEVTLSSFDEAPVGTLNTYSQPLAFEPGESPAGYYYLVLLEGVDAEGNPTTEQYEVELPVLGAECTFDACPEEAFASFADGQASVSVVQNGEGFELWLAATGEVNSSPFFNVIFEEPFDGPVPLETEIPLDFKGQANKWTTRGSTSVPSTYTFKALTIDGEGQVLEEVQGSGSGTGNVYRTSGNGKGTRRGIRHVQMGQVPLL